MIISKQDHSFGVNRVRLTLPKPLPGYYSRVTLSTTAAADIYLSGRLDTLANLIATRILNTDWSASVRLHQTAPIVVEDTELGIAVDIDAPMGSAPFAFVTQLPSDAGFASVTVATGFAASARKTARIFRAERGVVYYTPLTAALQAKVAYAIYLLQPQSRRAQLVAANPNIVTNLQTHANDVSNWHPLAMLLPEDMYELGDRLYVHRPISTAIPAIVGASTSGAAPVAAQAALDACIALALTSLTGSVYDTVTTTPQLLDILEDYGARRWIDASVSWLSLPLTLTSTVAVPAALRPLLANPASYITSVSSALAWSQADDSSLIEVDEYISSLLVFADRLVKWEGVDRANCTFAAGTLAHELDDRIVEALRLAGTVVTPLALLIADELLGRVTWRWSVPSGTALTSGQAALLQQLNRGIGYSLAALGADVTATINANGVTLSSTSNGAVFTGIVSGYSRYSSCLARYYAAADLTAATAQAMTILEFKHVIGAVSAALLTSSLSVVRPTADTHVFSIPGVLMAYLTRSLPGYAGSSPVIVSQRY